MRALLWFVAVLLLLGSVAIFAFLMRGKPSSVSMPKLGLSDLVNVAILLVAVASVYVAVATYADAKAAAEEQQKILEASRRSLESVVQTAEGQRTLLEQHLEASKTQLAVVQEQWQREQERQSRRAKLSMLSLNGRPWGQIEHDNRNIQAEVPATGVIRLTMLLRNTGTASLVRPLYMLSTMPENVFVDQADHRIGRADHNRLQLSGFNVLDILPYSASGTDCIISVDVTVPKTVANFEFMIKLIGENMQGALETTLHFAVTHQQ